MFDGFKGGPDWVSEKSLAQQALRTWRSAILTERSIYLKKVKEIKLAHEYEIRKRKIRTQHISDMFSRQRNTPSVPAAEPGSRQSYKTGSTPSVNTLYLDLM